MKPAHRVILACRQTAEAARRVGEWLEAGQSVLGLGQAATKQEVESLAARLGDIAAAAELAPAIGLIGGRPSAKRDLIISLLSHDGADAYGEVATRPADAHTLRLILTGEEGSGTTAVIRLSPGEATPAPRGYPIRIGILSEIEIASILIHARLSAPGAPPAMPSPEVAEALLADAAARVSLQPGTGVPSRDIDDLREGLLAEWGGHPAIDHLAAIGFLERLGEVAPHLEAPDRARLLAVLWGHDEATSSVFERLCAGLELIGNGAEAYCTGEALIGKDGITGWLIHHPSSILDVATLLQLRQSPGATLPLMTRHGQTLECERAILAGLIAELPLQGGGGALGELAPAELLDFPAPPAVSDIAPLAGADAFANAVARFARAKASFLFRRAAQRYDVTSLVVAVDPSGVDDSVAPLINDWIETAQGATAQARERVHGGLFFAAASPADIDGRHAHRRAGEQVLAIIRDVLGSGQSWPTDWTPGRRLSNVYWFARSDGSADHAAPVPTALSGDTRSAPGITHADDTARGSQSGGQSGDQSGSPSALAVPALADVLPPTGVRSGPVSWGEQLRPIGSTGSGPLPATRTPHLGIGDLTLELRHASNPRAKAIQLTRAVADLRRRLRTTMARHHRSVDPTAISEWRRASAILVVNRLQSVAECGQLAHLQRALLPSETELLTVIAAAAGARSSGMERGPTMADRLFNGTPAVPDATSSGGRLHGSLESEILRLAELAVAYWIGRLKRTWRARRLCREIGIEPQVLQHLVEELYLGAGRIGLAEEIASAYLESQPRTGAGSAPATATLAAYAARLTSAYLEVLGPIGDRGRAPQLGSSRSGDLEVADDGTSLYGRVGKIPRAAEFKFSVRAVAEQWEQSFTGLVEDNIAAASLSATRGDKDRELGDLIRLFTSGPFEVDA